ncbi:WxL domain-containing protein [Enterococcus sp. HY326]|uniref:WxL domain-containing protein n=1 Tax=Enterococcus sp. HY326 TaxID=2971265 RepID=UPI002240B305|nr:WxL domain-containing protein [Enterococcus sp. HY326]
MKFKRLCAAALIAAVGASVAGPVAANASALTLPSEGKVTIVQGDIDTPNTDLPDPEDDDKKIKVPDDDINENPNTGPLALMRTTNYDFGTMAKTGQATSAYAAPVTVEVYDKLDDPTDPATVFTEVTRGALVQWGDIDDSATSGYEVSANLSTQFTNTNSKTLDGATIKFSNGILATQTDGATDLESFESAFELSYNTPVIIAKGGTTNKGIYTAEYGQSPDYSPVANSIGYTGVADTDTTSVQLNVPAAANGGMEVGTTYTATITWSIARVA